MQRFYGLIFTLFSIVFLSTPLWVKAADADSSLPSSLTFSAGQDPYFGFYPSVSGSFGLTETSAFTFYGTFWTQSFMGRSLQLPADGFNLMTEFGIGLNFIMMDGKLSLTPQLGITSGNFQSGGGKVVFGDAIVPNLQATYTDGAVTVPLFICYWKGLRKERSSAPTPPGPDPYIDQIMYNVNPMYALNQRISVGVHYEHYFIGKKSGESPIVVGTNYLWTGPAVKFTVKSGASLWFTAGIDWVEYTRPNASEEEKIMKDFYKMLVTLPF